MSTATAAEPPELRAGDTFGGKYLLLEPIAFGGMGIVWKAQNLVTGGEVAAKFLLPDQAASPDAIVRFRREARATATLAHRAIVRVFDMVELDAGTGALVLILELLRGHSLASRLHAMGPMTVDETLALAIPILSALSHAHSVGIVHRDLKPDNVFLAVDPDGRILPRLVDFGVSRMASEARITLDGTIVGTLSYLSPEQTMGGTVDPRSDIFAMGILLYECLTARNPFDDSFRDGGPPLNLMSIFEAAPRRPDGIPDALWDVVQRALSFRPDDRFESAGDLADALGRAVSSAHDADRPPSSRQSGAPSLPVIAAAPQAFSRTDRANAVKRPMAIVAAATAAAILGVAFGASAGVHVGSSMPAHADVVMREPHAARLLVPAADVAHTGEVEKVDAVAPPRATKGATARARIPAVWMAGPGGKLVAITRAQATAMARTHGS